MKDWPTDEEIRDNHKALTPDGNPDGVTLADVRTEANCPDGAGCEAHPWGHFRRETTQTQTYEPSAIVLGLITFYQTKIGHPLDIRAGILGAIREAVRIEAGMTDAEALEWVRKIS